MEIDGVKGAAPVKMATPSGPVAQTFYATNVTYDLTRQWVAMPGKFDYDYRWLSSKGTPEVMKNFADTHFEKVYGVHPDRFEIL